VRSAFVTTIVVLWPASGIAGPLQDWIVAYSHIQLQCARFHEAGESSIYTESGGRIRNQTSQRRGSWQFRASPGKSGVALEAWLDSLSLMRSSAETTISPDTDGLLGGRYRGILNPVGVYVTEAQPFIPDEVAEVAGMATAMDDFFPRLPPTPLLVGKSWTDSAGLTIRRLADSSLSGLPLFRYELERRNQTRVAATRGDSTLVPHTQVSEERGTFVWHPTLGLVRRDRKIVLETSVPVSRTVRQPVRSKVEQQITVIRDLTGDPTACGKEGTH
jgi:hypothetical protein